MACGWRAAELGSFAMARIKITNGPSCFRPQSAEKAQSGSSLEIEAWTPSEVEAIAPLVGQLMGLIERSHCVTGEEPKIELALQEALNNAVVHGNRMDSRKVVHVLCRCELGKGVSLVVSDEGQGFDPSAVPDPVANENLECPHGRGIYFMKSLMDEVSFEREGTEIHMRKWRKCDS